jgi:type II secretory pathway component PulJ
MRRNKGFTAVELIVAVCIFSMVSYAVYSLLAGGLNAYKRIRNFAGSQIDVLTAFEKMERDLENTFYISGINFSGDGRSVSFAGSGPVSKVAYIYDETSGKLPDVSSPMLRHVRVGDGRHNLRGPDAVKRPGVQVLPLR